MDSEIITAPQDPTGAIFDDGTEVVPSESAYRVKLAGFEGPLDLLLHLIKENKMSIQEIQISIILDQYLEHLKIITELNVDNAGEFLLMAAQLAYIKSRSLLPPDEQPMEEEDEEDPRARLIEQLIEYEKFKRVAASLSERDVLNRDVFGRGTAEVIEAVDGQDRYEEVSVFKLLEILDQVMQNAPRDVVHQIITEKISVSRRILELLEQLKAKGVLSVFEVFPPGSAKQALIVCFLAILELAKHQLIRIYQSALYGDVQVVGVQENLSSEKTELLFQETEITV